ncbi:GGDEF domain-containing protein [Colwellia sp. MEBiC06753]
MKVKIQSYAEYEQKFKRELYKLAFSAFVLFCSFYLYANVMRGDYLDALSNLIAIVLSVFGLIYMHYYKDIGRIHFLPAIIYLNLFLGSFIGSAQHTDASSLLWCNLFLPCLVLTIGHLKAIPYIALVQAFVIYVFFIDPSAGLHGEYTIDEKKTYIITSTFLVALAWYSEYMRFKLSKGLYVENVEKKRMQYLSSHDELTGLYNRRGFNEQVKDLKFFSKRQGDQHAIIMLDIDDFKQVNDMYGHDFGDQVLTNIARLQLATVRNSDTVVRWGGEEFLILLTNIEAEQVGRIAENIRKNIEKTPVATQEVTINITVSLGVAFSQETNTIDSLIKLADKRLYDAKRGGKNRIYSIDTVSPV